jgi:hypothetical protein
VRAAVKLWIVTDHYGVLFDQDCQVFATAEEADALFAARGWRSYEAFRLARELHFGNDDAAAAGYTQEQLDTLPDFDEDYDEVFCYEVDVPGIAPVPRREAA